MTYETITADHTAPIKAWVKGVPVEPEARKQFINTARLPFIHRHVAVMPDVHWGLRATVGSVVPTIGAIIPAAVGVDIGCGMCAVRTSFTADDLPESLASMRSAIEQAVPHGRSDNGGLRDRGAWGTAPARAIEVFDCIAAVHTSQPDLNYSCLCVHNALSAVFMANAPHGSRSLDVPWAWLMKVGGMNQCGDHWMEITGSSI